VWGKTGYYAWYEFYPNPSFEISGLTIKPGDHMAAKVAYNGSEFTITIKDETNGQVLQQEFDGKEREAVVGRMDYGGALLHFQRRYPAPRRFRHGAFR